MPSKYTPSAKRSAFTAAAIGSLAPQLLRWYSQGALSIPDDSLGKIVGWVFVTALFTLLAGYLGAYIFQETDMRKAFFVGVSVPSIILSGGPDLKTILTPGTASGQPRVAQSTGTLEVRAKSSGGQPMTGVRISVTEPGGAYEASSASNPADFSLPPGRYAVTIEASGYEAQTQKAVTVRPGDRTSLEVTLQKRSFLGDFLRGAQRPFEQKR